MSSTSIISQIQDMANKHDVFISYEIINQINNGEGKNVEKGLIPRITFTVYVLDSQGTEMGIESHNDLQAALERGVDIAKVYIKNTNF